MTKKYSTVEAARMLGMRQPHLQRAIAQGKVKAPPVVKVGPVKVRLWTLRDIRRAAKALGRRMS
jgi:hypothetical protein